MGNNVTLLKRHHAVMAASSPKLATVSGTQSISLPKALSMPLKSLKIEGSSTLSATPTPSAPADIECNNGTLVPGHESGLPLGYTLLDSVGCSSSHDIATPIYLASTDVVECRFRNSATTGYGALYGTFAMGDSSAFYANGTYYGYNSSNTKIDTGIDIDTNWHTLRHDFINGEITIDEETTTFTPFTFTNSKAMHIFSRYYNNSYGYYWKGYISYFRVYRNGKLICNYIPAKYNGDVGVYDLVNEEFLFGTSILEGTAVNDPITAITMGAHNTITLNSQTANVADLLAVGDYKDEQDIINGSIVRRLKVKVLDGTENWTDIDEYGRTSIQLASMKNSTGPRTIPGYCNYFENLHNSEPIADVVAGQFYLAAPQRIYFHIQQEDLATFKEWLAERYSAGAPVVVIYPLASSTIQEITPVVLQTTLNTTNTITTTNNIVVQYWRKPF